MQKVSRPQDKWGNVILASISIIIVLADQLSKLWIMENLANGQTLFDAGYFQMIRTQNTGAAFGIFQGQTQILSVISFIGVLVLLVFGFFLCRRWPEFDNMLVKVAIGLVLGGTVGNLIDRVWRHSVTDFIDFKIWPAFNVADASVTIGILLIAYFLIRMVLAENRTDE